MASLFVKKSRIFAEFSFLYFLQGIPYGFQGKYLPLLMRQQGHQLSNISFINLVSLPWILKFTWAKLFDRLENYERHWISGCLLLLSLASLSFDIQLSFSVFPALILLLMSFLSASLDIAVDALAIRTFEEKDLGYCNIVHVVGYKFGILCGGGILTILSSFCNLNNFSFIVSVVYCVTALYFTIADSQIFTKKAQTTKPGGNEGTEKELHINKLIIIQMVSSPEQIWLLFFVFCYKIGEQGFMSIYPLRLIDQGLEMKHIGMVTGIVGQSFSIVGSSFGGLLISRFRINLKTLLCCVALMKWILMIIYALYLALITSTFILHVIIESSFQLLAGTMTTATFTSMMMSSKRLAPNAHAFHFAIVAAVEVVGKLGIKSFAGMITEHIGYDNFFIFCCFMDSIVVLLALWNAKLSFAWKKSKKD